MFSFIIIYSLFWAIANIFFQPCNNVFGVIVNVLIFCLDCSDNRKCVWSKHSLVKFQYKVCTHKWNGSVGSGIICFISVIWFTEIWWCHVTFVIVSTSNGVWFVLYQDINWTNSLLLLVASLRNFITYFCHLNMWSPTPVIPLLSWRYRPVMLPFVVNARISSLLNSSYIQTSQNIVCPQTQSKLEKNAGNSSGTK